MEDFLHCNRNVKQGGIDTHPSFKRSPSGNTSAEIPQYPDDNHTRAQTIGPGLDTQAGNVDFTHFIQN